jgi:hypothetical protein
LSCLWELALFGVNQCLQHGERMTIVMEALHSTNK